MHKNGDSWLKLCLLLFLLYIAGENQFDFNSITNLFHFIVFVFKLCSRKNEYLFWMQNGSTDEEPEEDSDKPRFTLQELRDVLQEKNELKAQVFLLQEELAYYKRYDFLHRHKIWLGADAKADIDLLLILQWWAEHWGEHRLHCLLSVSSSELTCGWSPWIRNKTLVSDEFVCYGFLTPVIWNISTLLLCRITWPNNTWLNNTDFT